MRKLGYENVRDMLVGCTILSTGRADYVSIEDKMMQRGLQDGKNIRI